MNLSIFGYYLPAGLPPLRSISDQIDLIQGSSLPNKAPYWMTPIESGEVNKQVQELFDRGLIEESLSPCVAPKFLHPRKEVNGSCVLIPRILTILLSSIYFLYQGWMTSWIV
jgi:hypothetical protein